MLLEFKKISKKSLLIQELLAALIWFVLSVFPFAYLDKGTVLWKTSLLVLLVVYIFFACLYFPKKYCNTGYYLCGNKIHFKTGVIIRRQRIMNIKSVISVSLTQNPWTPIFNVASVTVNAAGSKIRLPYLDLEEAHNIVSLLTPLSEI